jgi:hypothetical protein
VYRAPLAVHIVWHPAFDRGADYARAVFKHLFEDPDDVASHGLRIPVYHWRSAGKPVRDAEPPGEIPLESAERAVVVPLLDDHFLGTLGWDAFLEETSSRMREGDLLIPVQLTHRRPGAAQAVVLHEEPLELRLPRLLNQLTHRLWRLLAPSDAVTVPAFISYARSDGASIAKQVTAFLAASGSAGAFFAPRDVPRGESWRQELRQQARQSLLVAIRSDAYTGREWCQIEMLEAKRAGMPVVVLDALAAREARGFPYMGNGPALRWREQEPTLVLEELLGLMLREALRFRFFEMRVARLWSLQRMDGRPHVLAAAPELLTMLERATLAGDSSLLVYPDPPLGPDELDVIRRLDASVELVTPLMVLAS